MNKAAITDIKVFPVSGSEKVRANVFFNVGGMFKIKATLMQNEKGFFLTYPGRYFDDKATGAKKWASDVETLDKETTAYMMETIKAEYDKSLNGTPKTGSAGATNKPKPTGYDAGNW